jgi:general nucleoside transport system permease protein
MTTTRLRDAALVALALLIAMTVASVLILVYRQSPARVYRVMLTHTWGDVYGFGQVLFKATPLIFTGLAVAVAFQAGLVNIGAEGQMMVGAFAMACVGAGLPAGTPAVLALPAVLLAGALAGGLLGALPGYLKARFGAHEVINTIMLNFIAGALVLWAGRRYAFVPQNLHTRPVVPGAALPGLGLADSAASLAFILALVAAAACAWFLRRTRRGFELRALGKGPEAAEAGGVAVGSTIVLAMTLSGALAGLVGAGTVLGYKGYFEEGIGSGAGFMGIAVALLARSRPLLVIPAALLFGTLAQGGLEAGQLVPKEIVEVIQGVIILVVAATSAELRRAAPARGA